MDEPGRPLLHVDMLPVRYAGLRDQVRDFLTGELEAGSFVPRCDSWLTGFDAQFSRRVGERGWIGATFPKQYGGAGADAFVRFVIAEELLAAGAPVAAHWIADRQSGPSILRFGTEEQRQRYLPGIIRGELFFAIGMSEHQAGSDLAAVRTRAERVDGGWLVNGTKVWTSHAHHAHHMLTLVRTGPADANRRHAGLSQFIIDLASPGGAGADLRAATVVLLALGSLGASVPVVETGLMVGWLMERAGARLPGGIVTAAVGDGLQVHSDDDGWIVSGTLTRVPWARHADYAVVLSHAGAWPYAAVVPLTGAELRRGANVAGEPRDDVVLSSVAVPSADVYAPDGPELGAVDLLRRGAFGRSVLMAGAAQGVYAHAARYASERRQFGKPLAAMQAVQQQLAELAAEASAMTVAAEAAAAAVDLDPAESWPLDAARIRIAGAAGTVAAIGHQILGAIGFTDEHPLHRLTTRLWAWREEYGNHAIWSERLGSVLAGKDGLTLWQRMTR